MIWNRIPKNIFVGFDVLQFGVYDAVAHFSIGAEAAVEIFKEVNLDPGEYFLTGMRKINKERIAKADFKGKEVNKKKRKMLRGLKKKKGDKLKQEEGTLYKPGAFWNIFFKNSKLWTPINTL